MQTNTRPLSNYSVIPFFHHPLLKMEFREGFHCMDLAGKKSINQTSRGRRAPSSVQCREKKGIKTRQAEKEEKKKSDQSAKSASSSVCCCC
ncbi:hypothetical protein AVEN_151005-1 [Araneus ventricosus]|uniref:Uncharacterized protein n=1 Tax=Araneus ventricosus TaxID=182803 RepID=A0A4Y2PET8_ARAVE|nr:hypothetical protein AVEN_151005-1 [Araneus ventricosus]